VPSVLLLESGEITLSGVLALFMVGSPERSHRVVCQLISFWEVQRDHIDWRACCFVDEVK
jgi:hypothetical protein